MKKKIYKNCSTLCDVPEIYRYSGFILQVDLVSGQIKILLGHNCAITGAEMKINKRKYEAFEN